MCPLAWWWQLLEEMRGRREAEAAQFREQLREERQQAQQEMQERERAIGARTFALQQVRRPMHPPRLSLRRPSD